MSTWVDMYVVIQNGTDDSTSDVYVRIIDDSCLDKEVKDELRLLSPVHERLMEKAKKTLRDTQDE